jgi:hypothetical protein
MANLFFKFLFVVLFSINSLAAINITQKDIEYYTDRPNILEIRARTTKNSDWQKLNWAQLEFIAQLLGLYPKQHFFFLARDGEYLYDLGLVLTENQPTLRKRLHLINVSRNNQNSNYLKQYLLDSGLTEAFIKKNGVVFVDSGFSGSIAKHIKTKYSSATQHKMLIHLIESQDNSIPASEIFKSRDAMDAGSYEEMVRYFDRSNGFKQLKGRLVPISPKGSDEPYDSDGTVDKKEAFKYMQSMTAFGRSKAAQEKFQQRLAQWKYLSDVTYNPKYSLEQVIQVLEKVKKTWKSEVAEAMIQDFVSFYNLASGKKIQLGEVTFDTGYKGEPSTLRFDFDTMLNELASSYDKDHKNYTERDFNDLMFVIKWHFKNNGVDSILQFFDSIGSKNFFPLIQKIQHYMGQKEFEKFFHQVVQNLDYTNQKQWFEAYKKLQIESRLIKKELQNKLQENEAYANPADVRACRRAIGA